MKVRDLIERLKDFNPEATLEFASLTEYGFGEQMVITVEDCDIQEEDDFVQLIISGEI